MNFEELLTKCAGAAYPEPQSELHSIIGTQAANWINGVLKPGSTVLDVGCGSAFACGIFQKLGHKPTAVSVLAEEVENAKALGFDAMQCEMHSIDTLTRKFDLIWLRHVAEHSPCPMMLLHKCHECANDGGFLYLEVPMPWTACIHENNPDHFSVLGTLAWENLLRRSGWQVIAQNHWPFVVQAGPDAYHSFICRKHA